MKKIFLLSSALPLLTGCATFHNHDELKFSTIGTAIFYLFIIVLSTPSLSYFFSFFQTGEKSEYQKTLEQDVEALSQNKAERKNLQSYKTANISLMLSFCAPACIWILILLGAGGGWGNCLGFIIGCICAGVLSNKYFLYDSDTYGLTVIMRLVMLIIAIVCFCIGY